MYLLFVLTETPWYLLRVTISGGGLFPGAFRNLNKPSPPSKTQASHPTLQSLEDVWDFGPIEGLVTAEDDYPPN